MRRRAVLVMRPLAAEPFVVANLIEAALWCVIGGVVLLHAMLKRGRLYSVIAGVTFLLFGLSDVVETRTGAWWRPWWLLAWKGACLAVFLALVLCHFARRRHAIPDTAHREASNPASP